MREKGAHGTQENAAGQERAPEDQLGSLVARAKQGDIEAFERLYQHFSGKILNYIYRMTGSREEAEDLMQDTFILAHRNLGSLKENEKFQSWLFRIAKNNVYQKYRRKPAQIESIDADSAPELSEAHRLETPMKGPEESALSGELEETIERAISELSEKYREVFVLSAIHKLSYREISEILGRSLAAIKSDIHRARVQVRDKIKEYLGDQYGM